jgi:hypothetical protein
MRIATSLDKGLKMIAQKQTRRRRHAIGPEVAVVGDPG